MSIFSTAINAYVIYRFLRTLTTPWNKMEAYKLGIIDDSGNVLKKRASLKTENERNAYTMFDQMVWKLKRLLNKLPFGKSTIASYAAALWFLKENNIENFSNLENSFKDYLIKERGYSLEMFNTFLAENYNFPAGTFKLNKEISDLEDNIIINTADVILITKKSS